MQAQLVQRSGASNACSCKGICERMEQQDLGIRPRASSSIAQGPHSYSATVSMSVDVTHVVEQQKRPNKLGPPMDTVVVHSHGHMEQYYEPHHTVRSCPESAHLWRKWSLMLTLRASVSFGVALEGATTAAAAMPQSP
eukprot:3838980-Amphidinium_carterae.2